jgi:hypothetical protein
LKYIFQTFPPKTDGPKTYNEQVTGSLDRKDLLKVRLPVFAKNTADDCIWSQMIARFHPDKNTEHGEEWKLTCSEVSLCTSQCD